MSFYDGKNAFPGLEATSIRDYSALILAYFEMEQNGGQMQTHKVTNKIYCEAV